MRIQKKSFIGYNVFTFKFIRYNMSLNTIIMYKIENLSCITRTGLEAIFYSQHARKKKLKNSITSINLGK